MRGLFDTDGNLFFRKSYGNLNEFKNKNNHYPIIKITTTSKFLMEGVIKMLHDLDINFCYYNRESKKPNENKKYILSISGLDGLDKWMDLIGIKNPVKLSRHLVWKKFGFCSTHTTLKQREELLKKN